MPTPPRTAPQRVRRALVRARVVGRHRPRSLGGRGASLLVVVAFGLMVTIAAVNAHGADLRADRNADLATLVRTQADRNKTMALQAGRLRAEVDKLSQQEANDPALEQQLQAASVAAGTTAVKGPAVRVTLTDAPLSVQPPGVDPDLLVVHQQDIQMVVNVLWAAGAEAMTIQGQRVISTTGVKCVGNSVVLHGVPYGPPYVIVAIGNSSVLLAALGSSPEVKVYQQYVEAYQLGWQQETLAETVLPAYTGSVDLQAASTPGR